MIKIAASPIIVDYTLGGATLESGRDTRYVSQSQVSRFIDASMNRYTASRKHEWWATAGNNTPGWY